MGAAGATEVCSIAWLTLWRVDVWTDVATITGVSCGGWGEQARGFRDMQRRMCSWLCVHGRARRIFAVGCVCTAGARCLIGIARAPYNMVVSALFRMRPRYELRCDDAAVVVRRRIAAAMAVTEATCRGEVEEHRIVVMTNAEHHFWSPELRVAVVDGDSGCVLRGRFGPRPAVWTMFAAIYAHLIFIGVAGAMYAMAQLALGRTPTAAWTIPIVIVVAVLVRVVAHIGQSLGADEMQVIRRFMSSAVVHGDDVVSNVK